VAQSVGSRIAGQNGKGMGFDPHSATAKEGIFLCPDVDSSGGSELLGPYSPITRDGLPHLPTNQ
jgi:hypothetical protein